MPKFDCVCGQTIPVSGLVPNPNEWRILSDIAFDGLDPLACSEDVYQKSLPMYLCPASGHIWVYWDGLGSEPRLYAPSEAT